MYAKIPKNSITRIEIIKTDCSMTLQEVVRTYGCKYAINGGLYDMKTGKVNPIPLRIKGKTIATSKDGYWMMAWNHGPDLCMIHSKDMAKWKNAVACSAFLKDGSNTIFNYTSAQGGIRGRTAFGDDDHHAYLFVTTDSKQPLSPLALRSNVKSLGAKNAIMLDCGGSSQGYFNGTYVQGERRMVSYWICIWTADTARPPVTIKSCPYREPAELIKMDSNGEGVRWVQWHLRATVASSLPITGNFYTQTKKAVIKFQKANNLSADGMVGPATRAAMKKAVT